MHRRDEIDATLAKHFAWTFVRPEDSAAVDERLRAVEAAATARASEREGFATLSAKGTARDSTAGSGSPGQVALADAPRCDDTVQERSAAKAHSACRVLAEGVSQAWAESEPAACLRATKRLLSRADRLGVELLEMRDWPTEDRKSVV